MHHLIGKMVVVSLSVLQTSHQTGIQDTPVARLKTSINSLAVNVQHVLRDDMPLVMYNTQGADASAVMQMWNRVTDTPAA